jgi:hypothetical protein
MMMLPLPKHQTALKIMLLAIFATFFSAAVKAQGCVAVRHMSSCTGGGTGATLFAKQWQVSVSYRQFRSFRHFSGTTENKERLELGTEVINKSKTADISATYALTNRLSVSAIVPLSYTDRSSLYEHDRVNRYHSQSKGLGDIRLMTNYYLLDPLTNPTQNISVGLGVKLPTGNYNTKDDFHIKKGEQVVLETRPVDQSMQLGDGGVAPILEVQMFKSLSTAFSVYGAGFYLFNVRDTTATRTYRETLRSTLANEKYMSVPDQLMARVGVSFAGLPVHGLALSLGGRLEGIPVYDMIGKENGFRRPGYIVSAEPTLAYMRGKSSFTLSVPVALIRNRTQSVTDKAMNRHGDAAFADYLVFINYGIRI